MIHYWLEAVVDELRSSLTDSFITDRTSNILVMPDGKPAATGGVVFIAVHPGGSFNPLVDTYGDTIQESYEVTCTISQRTRNVPEDRIGKSLFIEQTKSLSRIAVKVRESIANVLSLKTDVEALMAAESVSGGVVELLRWSRISPPVPRDKFWFMSTDPYDADTQPAGYSCEVTFVGGSIMYGTGC